jgi:hypothetical protein
MSYYVNLNMMITMELSQNCTVIVQKSVLAGDWDAIGERISIGPGPCGPCRPKIPARESQATEKKGKTVVTAGGSAQVTQGRWTAAAF